MIDGFYIRHALQGHALEHEQMLGLINNYWCMSII